MPRSGTLSSLTGPGMFGLNVEPREAGASGAAGNAGRRGEREYERAPRAVLCDGRSAVHNHR